MSINKFVEQTWPSVLYERYKEKEPAPSHISPKVVVRKLTQREIEEASKGMYLRSGKELSTNRLHNHTSMISSTPQPSHKTQSTQTEGNGQTTYESQSNQIERNRTETRGPVFNRLSMITKVSQERRKCLRGWQDWRCQVCEGRNPAIWYTCNKPNCIGEATDRQLPEFSWQCKLVCGQNNWALDHYCNACLRPNPTINPSGLRPRPVRMERRPRGLQQWFSRPPMLEP